MSSSISQDLIDERQKVENQCVKCYISEFAAFIQSLLDKDAKESKDPKDQEKFVIQVRLANKIFCNVIRSDLEANTITSILDEADSGYNKKGISKTGLKIILAFFW